MSIFPFISQDEVVETTELPIYKEYAYDFEENKLKTTNGQTYLVEKNEAIKIWIYKSIKSERFRYLAYSEVYGCEVDTLIGKVRNDILYSEIKRFIIEALMINPYIEELNNFVFSNIKSTVFVNFECTTVYGTFHYTWEMEASY